MIAPAKSRVTLGFGVTDQAGYTPANPHAGVDFSWEEDDNIYAPEDAVVSTVGWMGTAGQATDLVAGSHRHRVCHQSLVLVSPGQSVVKGQLIGVMGDTGYTFGRHLHWVMWVDGVRVNGLDYVNEEEQTMEDRYDTVPSRDDIRDHYQKRMLRDPSEAELANRDKLRWSQILDDNVTELGKRLQAAEVAAGSQYEQVNETLFKKR